MRTRFALCCVIGPRWKKPPRIHPTDGGPTIRSSTCPLLSLSPTPKRFFDEIRSALRRKKARLSPSVRRMKRKSCSKAENRISEIDQLLNSLLRHSETLLQRSDDRMANSQRRKDAFCCRQQKIASFFANRERGRGMSCRFAQRKGLGGWKGPTGWARHSSPSFG